MSKPKANRKLYLCAFLLPFVITVFICIRNGVYPFGENCILHIDMYHQYEPFFTEFMNKLKHGESLLYSFHLGLGSDFVSLMAYYLASPLNWLLLLWPADYVIEFMTILVLLKIGLCGLSFAVYLQNHFDHMDWGSVIFSAFYALSGYMAAYSWNIMWLDCLVFAPLAVLGLERLVKEGRCRLYGITLAAAVLSNFYIAFMLCIFLTIWFVILFFEETHGIKEKVCSIGRFILYSSLAGGMGAVLILPEAAVLGYSGSSGFSFPDAAEWYFDIVSMLARHCINVEAYTGRDHWPNLYCGAAVFFLLTLYFFNRAIPWKKKIRRIVLVVFFWISFASNILDFMWHGLHFPDSLPGRQVYLYVFLMLVLAYEGYINRKSNTWLDAVLGIVLSLGFLTAAAYIVDTGMVSGSSLAVTGMLVIGYGLLFLLQIIKSGERKFFVQCMLFIFAVTELFANFAVTGFSTTSRVSYTKDWESVKSLLAKVEEMGDEPFYRIEEMERLTKNDAAIYGYPSSTIFSSLMNIGVGRFYKNLGMEGGKNFYSYSGSTPLTSAFLSVKYLIAKNPYEESPLRTLAAEDGQNYIYKNLYTLPLGFMLDVDFESRWDMKKGEAINNLNRMARALGAKEDLLIPFHGEVEAEEEKTTAFVYKDSYLYGTYTDTTVTNLTVTNQKRVRKFSKCDHGYILDLGWCEAGDTVEITNSSKVSDFNVTVYQLNLDALDFSYAKLQEQTLELDRFSDTKIEGHIDVKNAGNLIISIPKEDGWQIFVDGKKTDGGIFMDSLMKIPLTSGEHRITLRYMTPNLVPGAVISLFSLGCFLALCIGRKRRVLNGNPL